MDTTPHNLATLFQQLGLNPAEAAIEQFIASHRPLDDAIRLPDAPWWNAAQAAFLQEAIDQDADWAEQVDELDAMLRRHD